MADLSKRLTKKIAKNLLQEAIDWFKSVVKGVPVNPTGPGEDLPDTRHMLKRLTPKQAIGRMYMFIYDPKTKDTLPYYDRLPLVIPFSFHSDGFTGLNLHYISPLQRAKLLDAFSGILNNSKYDDTTKIRLTYGILQSASKYKYYKPCVKRYLNNHVKSKFIEVQPSQWMHAVLLPTEKFVKASKTQVFIDSRNIIQGRKP